MATIIRRDSEIGDHRLPRMPFAEPGPQPVARLSGLAWQGSDGEIVDRVADVEAGRGLTRPSDGVGAVYRVPESGVPGYEFNQSIPGASPELKAGLHAPNSGGSVIKSMLAVVRVDRLPTAPVAFESESRLVSSYYGVAEGIYVTSTAHTTNPGCLVGRGGNGGNAIIGPQIPADGALRFVALAFDGATGRLYLDGEQMSGAIGANQIGPHLNVGNSLSGGRFTVVEASQYTVSLSRAQVEQKRAHYRALYQF